MNKIIYIWIVFWLCSCSAETPQAHLGDMFLRIEGQDFSFTQTGDFLPVDANAYSPQVKFLSLLRENRTNFNLQSLHLRLTNFDLDQTNTPATINDNARLTFRLNRLVLEGERGQISVKISSKDKDFLRGEVNGTLIDINTQRRYRIEKCVFGMQIVRM